MPKAPPNFVVGQHNIGRERSSSMTHRQPKHQTVKCVVGNMASSETTNSFQANGVEDTPATDGMDGTAQRPKTPSNPSRSDVPLARTPSLSSFSLTEYSAKPTTPPRDRETHMKNIVPDEFLLPNGNPDVSRLAFPSIYPYTYTTLVVGFISGVSACIAKVQNHHQPEILP
jgi:hypothetical protein